jgi:meiotically up-regulated gene 157 (Mug157) protein
MRPIEPCRTFVSHEVEETIERLRNVIVDPDLLRVFENSWPSTLDTTIEWRGFANGSLNVGSNPDRDGESGDSGMQAGSSVEREELSFVITGDIEAMWLRDSANQLQAYVSLLQPNSSFDSLASLFRGAINLQARYILEAPFCNAFQAPFESLIPSKSSMNSDQIAPSYDFMKVFSCNWELDSLASFLQLSADYFERTNDISFFARWNWTSAVRTILHTAQSMTVGSYSEDGTWTHTPYTYCAPYGGTPINQCNGSPHRGNIGLIRSFHRPSDDACTYQYLIPSNMMFSVMLNRSASILQRIEPPGSNLTSWMRNMSAGIRSGIETHGVVKDPKYGKIYAYEIDGYGSANIMDDPNIPSLLSAPFLGYTTPHNPIYANTRRKILSKDNPYFSWGPVISGIGSPHTLPGKPWPMANIMAILTSEDDGEIVRNLRILVGSTDRTGLMHESVDSHVSGERSRQW